MYEIVIKNAADLNVGGTLTERHKNMKKILILLLIASLIMTFLTSCKKDEDESKEKTEENTEDNTEDNTGNNNGGEEDLPGVDFLNDDLSSYVVISEKYYKNYTVVVDPNRVSALDIENKIIQVLCKYKSKEKVDGDGIISVGDVAKIYYKGYYMKDGEPCYFDGGSNMNSSSPHSLEIGSGGFIPGFEYNLIGKNPAEYSDENPLIVETYFPENYGVEELNGVTAYFIVKVDSLDEYDAPPLDDNFITETLKLTADALSEFDGETLTDKYRSYVKEQVINENGLDTETLAMNAFWESVMAGAVINKYPEKQLKEAYDSYVSQINYNYQYYGAYFKSLDDCACYLLGLASGSDWKSVLTEMAEDQVKQQLIFYQIMNQEGLKPTEDEYEELFDEYLVSALEGNGITPEKYQTEEEYLTVKENYKKQMLESRGEEYYKSAIYYGVTAKAIIGYANIVETTE